MCAASRSAQGLFFSSLCLLAMTLQIEALAEGASGDGSDVGPPKLDPQQLPLLIAQLDHRLFDTREQATEALARAGVDAVPHLAEAIEGESLEAADRSIGLLEEFAQSDDRHLQLAALSSLVEAHEFATARYRAERQLTRLHEKICAERFAAWGSEARGLPSLSYLGWPTDAGGVDNPP